MVHELRALHSVWCVGGFVRIVSKGYACGCRRHYCVVDMRDINGRYEGVEVDKGSCGRGRDKEAMVVLRGLMVSALIFASPPALPNSSHSACGF